MGVVTQRLAEAALAAGAAIHTSCPVQQIEVQDGRATGACAGALCSAAFMMGLRASCCM